MLEMVSKMAEFVEKREIVFRYLITNRFRSYFEERASVLDGDAKEANDDFLLSGQHRRQNLCPCELCDFLDRLAGAIRLLLEPTNLHSYLFSFLIEFR